MVRLERPDAILYDWDNTLVDTWPVIHESMNVLLRYMDMPEWSLAETRSNVRRSMRDAFPELFGERWEEARDVFYKAFENVHMDALKPAEGSPKALKEIHAAGILQAVVSNKQGPYLRKEVEALNWQTCFHKLIGAGDANQDKPSPDPVYLALKGTGLIANRKILFVGDSDVDMQIAHATGLTPILIHENPDLEGEFKTCMPSCIFKDMFHFLEAIDLS